MEVCQLLMQLGRTFEWLDVLANATGTLAGMLIYFILFKRIKKLNPQ